MRFKFILKAASCCGGGGENTLRSANYCIDPTSVSTSIVKAFDSFNTNYHTTPKEIIVNSTELKLMQDNLPSTEFSFIGGKLLYRKFPITIVE
jgi:hypothetical protein